MEHWIDIKNGKIKQLQQNCQDVIDGLDLSNTDKRTKQWVTYRWMKSSIQHYQDSIEWNETKRK